MNPLKQIRNEFTEKIRAKDKIARWLALCSCLLAIPSAIYFSLGLPSRASFSPFGDAFLPIVFGITFFYVYFWLGIIGLFCWSMYEIVSPRVQTRYSKIKALVNVLMNTPDKDSFLTAIKMFNDIQEKTGIKEYWEISEIFANVYKRIRTQGERIDELESKLESDKQEKQRLRNTVDDLSSKLSDLQKKVSEIEK